MSRTLIVRPAAEADLAEARGWYEQQRSGLGDEFIGEVDAVVARVLEAPRLHEQVHKDVRRALTQHRAISFQLVSH